MIRKRLNMPRVGDKERRKGDRGYEGSDRTARRAYTTFDLLKVRAGRRITIAHRISRFNKYNQLETDDLVGASLFPLVLGAALVFDRGTLRREHNNPLASHHSTRQEAGGHRIRFSVGT